MSFSVLVITEDPTKDGYIVRPLISRLMKECGRAQAKINVVTNPRTQGYADAKAKLFEHIIEAYSYYDLFLFIADADGKDRGREFDSMEAEAGRKGVKLFCVAARQELEAWLLSGHLKKLTFPWEQIREDVSVKENVFEPFLKHYGDPNSADGGRGLLMTEALEQFYGILQRCPELMDLKDRITALLREF